MKGIVVELDFDLFIGFFYDDVVIAIGGMNGLVSETGR